ncbi:MAG: Bro-N domain-containing protein [Syntrophobacteraceae bacterium]
MDDEQWFVASDVAKALGYSAFGRAIKVKCREARKHPVVTKGQVHPMTIIPERDVHCLINDSKLPAAAVFRALFF